MGRPGGGRERRAAALVAVIVAMLPVGSAFAAPLGLNPAPDARAVHTQSWLETLIDLLQLIYILMGGNPTDLDNAQDAETAMSIVSSYWAAHGLPSGLTNAQKQAMVADIDNTSAHLNSAPSEVSSSAVAAFRATLATIRSLVVVPDDP